MPFAHAALAALALLCAPAAAAEDAVPRVSVQIDLPPFAVKGYSAYLGLVPAPHWNVRWGVAAGEPPSFGGPDGLTTRLRSAVSLGVEYYPRPTSDGFAVSLVLGRFEWTYLRDDTPGVAVPRDQLLILPLLGYRWFPSRSAGFFVEPQLGPGVPFQADDVSAAPDGFVPAVPIFPAVFVFAGWEWGR